MEGGWATAVFVRPWDIPKIGLLTKMSVASGLKTNKTTLYDPHKSHGTRLMSIPPICQLLSVFSHPPEWYSGLRHCIAVLEASLQTWLEPRMCHNQPWRGVPKGSAQFAQRHPGWLSLLLIYNVENIEIKTNPWMSRCVQTFDWYCFLGDNSKGPTFHRH
jgi:hypothetical protein